MITGLYKKIKAHRLFGISCVLYRDLSIYTLKAENLIVKFIIILYDYCYKK